MLEDRKDQVGGLQGARFREGRGNSLPGQAPSLVLDPSMPTAESFPSFDAKQKPVQRLKVRSRTNEL